MIIPGKKRKKKKKTKKKNGKIFFDLFLSVCLSSYNHHRRSVSRFLLFGIDFYPSRGLKGTPNIPSVPVNPEMLFTDEKKNKENAKKKEEKKNPEAGL